MFKCQGACGKVVGPGIKPITLVVETRKVVYRQWDPQTGEARVFNGTEIVREKKFCPDCAGGAQ